MIESITLLGSASGRNAGDAALMAAIMDGIDQACGAPLRYEIPTLRPDYVRRHYPNRVRPVGMMPWHGALRMLGLPTLRSLRRTDLAVIFDAILFDRALFNPLFNFMSSLYVLLPLVQRRKPAIGYNVGIGPVHTPAGRFMLRAIARRLRFITVRDRASREALRAAGVRHPRVRVTADAALAAPAWEPARVRAVFRELGLDPDRPVLGVNVNRYLDTWASAGRPSMGAETFLRIYAEALERAARRLGVPVLFVTTQHHDAAITTALMRRLSPDVRTALADNCRFDHAAVKGILRHVSLLCGMRLHSLIMASAELTPIVGIAYQPKVAGYFEELDQAEHVLSFDAFDADRLCAHILRGWERRAALRAALERNIPVLRARSLESARLVAALRRGEPDANAAWDETPDGT